MYGDIFFFLVFGLFKFLDSDKFVLREAGLPPPPPVSDASDSREGGVGTMPRSRGWPLARASEPRASERAYADWPVTVNTD